MRCRIKFFQVACILLLIGSAGTVFAGEWPEKPVKIIVPYAAGGAADLTTRLAAQVAEKHLGQPIVIENRAGGGGVTGQSMGAKAAPDGYTLTEVSPSVITNPHSKKVDYSADSFVYTVNMLQDIEAIAVRADSDLTSVEALMEYAKANPNKLKVGVSGANNSDHLTAILFAQKTGIEWTPVPFNGAAQALASFLGGHVPVVIAGPAELAEQVRKGDVVYILAFSEKRMIDFPDIPTAKEKGIDVVMGPWRGIAAPKGTPEEIVDKIEAAYMKAFASPEFADAYRKADFFVDTYQNRADFNALIEREKEALPAILKEIAEAAAK